MLWAQQPIQAWQLTVFHKDPNGHPPSFQTKWSNNYTRELYSVESSSRSPPIWKASMASHEQS